MFRFTLREIFLLMSVVAICVGWWLGHLRTTHAVEKLEVVERLLEQTLAKYEEHTGRAMGVAGYTPSGEELSYQSPNYDRLTLSTPSNPEQQ